MPEGHGSSEPSGRSRLAARAAEKRQRILAAAKSNFVRHGFGGASVDRIAADAGVSKPTIYRYFADKEDLISAIASGVAEATLVPAATLGPNASLRATLLKACEAAVDAVFSDEVIALHRLAISEFYRFPKLARGYYRNGPRRSLEGVAEMLDHFRRRGELEFQDGACAARDFWSMAFGLAYQDRLIDPDWAMSRDDLLAAAARGIEHFLARYGVARH